MTTATPIVSVRFVAQGGKPKEGTAIARKGRALLISYQIQTGAPRERWIPGKRVLEIEGNVDDLPRYRSRSCPAYELETPIEHPGDCSRCGARHQPAAVLTELFYVDSGELIAEMDGWGHGPQSFARRYGLTIDRRDTGEMEDGYPVKAHYLGDRIVEDRTLVVAMKSRKLPDELVEEGVR